MKPILSISLLCCGRKKEEMRKCLDSLKPILEQLESELIIVDTGCDEEARGIIEEYTDHIVPFTWCDDFAKARNAGLKEAKGEWFLYIDDDEYFVEVQELIDFFRTGEYKEYGQACYRVRNYSNRQGTRYHDSWASRLIKIYPDTRFVERIHEYLVPIKGGNKLIQARADHYGYVYDTPEEKEQHRQRNLALLEQALKEESGNLRIRAHLANEYRAARDYQKLQEACEDSLRLLQKVKDPDYASWRQTFYQGKLMALVAMENYDEAERFFEEVIRDKRNDDLARAHLCSMGAGIYYEKQEYEKCEKCCLEYIQVYDAEGGEIRKLPLSLIFTQMVFLPGIRNNVYCVYMLSRLMRGDTGALKEYFWKLGWGDDYFTIYERFLPDLMEAWTRFPYEEEFVSIAQKLIEEDLVRDLTLDELKKKIQEKGDEALYPLACIFGQVESEHYYIWYLKVFHAAQEGQRESLVEAYQKLFKKLGDVLELEERVFALAQEQGIELSEVIAGIPFDRWRNSVDNFCGRNAPKHILTKKRYLEDSCREGDIRYDYFLLKAAEAQAIHTRNLTDYETICGSMREYADRSVAFYQRFFRPEAFEGEMEMIPASCRLALCIQRVLAAEETGNITAFREEVTGGMGVFGPMNDALQNFGKQYAAWREAQLQMEDRAVSDEMQILARQVKQQLRKFAAAGDKQTAQGILQQLKALVPGDPELAELEELCGE